MTDPALVPLWFVAREASRHVKVVLSGEGADELFGGYTNYGEPGSLAPFERLPGAVRAALGRVSTRLPDGMRGKDLLRRGALPLEQRFHGNPQVFAFAAGLPASEKLAGGTTKYALRRALDGIVRRTCCTGASSASRCRSGTGCARRCTSGRAVSWPTQEPGT